MIAAAGLMILGAATISNYTLDYLGTYAQDTLHMATTSAFGAVIMLGLCGVIGDLSAGWLADRYGRKRVLVLPWLGLLLLALPAFQLLNAWRTPAALLIATAVLTLLHIFASTPALILFIEALPARIRAGAIGIIYARRDRRVRRYHAARRQGADRLDREPARAGLVHDGGDPRRPDRRAVDPRAAPRPGRCPS